MKTRFALAVVASLALAACGTREDASSEAQADSVEMPADAAMAGVEEAPVADANANAAAPVDSTAEPATTEEQQIQEAGDSAADTAEAAADAMAEEAQ